MDAGALSTPRAREAWGVLRVRQWLIFAPLPAAGVARLVEIERGRAEELAVAALAASLSLAYAYGINAIADRRADADPEKNVLAGHDEVPLPAVASVTGAGLGALLAAGILGPWALGSIAASIAAGTVYSAGPRLKRLPVAGLLANHLIFLPLLFAAVRPGAVPASLGLLATVFALLLTQNQLLHEQADLAEDEAAGAKTTARWLGARGVRAVVAVLSAAVAASALMARTGVGALACVAGAVATAAVGASAWPAAWRRRAHRTLAATVGVALFLAEASLAR